MQTTHAYTTTVVSGDGTFAAEVISFPRYFDGKDGAEQLVETAVELGVVPGAPVRPEHVADMLGQIAFETPGLRNASLNSVAQTVREVSEEPIVIVEESPAIGRTLNQLLSQGAVAYVWIVEGKPILAVGGGALLVVVWFVSAPIAGSRRALEEAGYEATRDAVPLLKKWLRRRFRGRRSRTDR
jgi:hypothetical protein